MSSFGFIEEIPSLGLGTWKIAKDKAQEVVYHAIKHLGIRHIDCACDYGNEEEVGKGIAQAISEGVVKREDLWITSKLWNTYHRYEHVLPACKRSLDDLQLTYFDLYMIHFPLPLKYVPFHVRYPPEWIFDPTAAVPQLELDEEAPLARTWQGMEELVDRRIARHIGVCNFNVQLLMDLFSYAKIRPYNVQVELHPYLTQQKLLDFCFKRNIKVTGFSPLGSASYVELSMDNGLRLIDEPIVLQIAQEHQRTPAQILLAWGIARGCSVIPKASSFAHLEENAKSVEIKLTADQVTAVSGLNRNYRFNDPGVFCVGMGQSVPIYD